MATPKIGRRAYEGAEESFNQALREEEAALLQTKNDAIGVEVMTATSVEAEPSVLTVEAAAEFLIPYLPSDAQSLIREAHNTLARPYWQLLLGYALRCYEVGEIFAPMYLSAWESGNGKPDTDRPCARCGQVFFSRFPDAQYCCPPCFFEKLDQSGHADDCPTKDR